MGVAIYMASPLVANWFFSGSLVFFFVPSWLRMVPRQSFAVPDQVFIIPYRLLLDPSWLFGFLYGQYCFFKTSHVLFIGSSCLLTVLITSVWFDISSWLVFWTAVSDALRPLTNQDNFCNGRSGRSMFATRPCKDRQNYLTNLGKSFEDFARP